MKLKNLLLILLKINFLLISYIKASKNEDIYLINHNNNILNNKNTIDIILKMYKEVELNPLTKIKIISIGNLTTLNYKCFKYLLVLENLEFICIENTNKQPLSQMKRLINTLTLMSYPKNLNLILFYIEMERIQGYIRLNSFNCDISNMEFYLDNFKKNITNNITGDFMKEFVPSLKGMALILELCDLTLAINSHLNTKIEKENLAKLKYTQNQEIQEQNQKITKIL
jgi:hypothetical protein